MASTAVATAIGRGEDGRRRVPGTSVVDTESYDSWLEFPRGVRSRGVPGVRLVVSDAHPGLVRAVGEVFQGAAWQRCAAHLMRDRMREAGSRQLGRASAGSSPRRSAPRTPARPSPCTASPATCWRSAAPRRRRSSRRRGPTPSPASTSPPRTGSA